ncbi:MliC family protein [Gluconobacter morbifer]|nr:MliC family protein [Gluconobacter morbifer]
MAKLLGVLLFAWAVVASAALAAPSTPSAALTIPLSPAQTVSNQTVTYRCDDGQPKAAAGEALRRELPKEKLNARYINAGDVSLATLPVKGTTQVFANVIAADGAKYVAGPYVWWNKGMEATFFDAMSGDVRIICHQVSK